MNRSKSTDSLDKCDDENICYSSASSSPTEFTSDDETISYNMLLHSMMPRNKVPTKRKSRYESPPRNYRDYDNLLDDICSAVLDKHRDGQLETGLGQQNQEPNYDWNMGKSSLQLSAKELRYTKALSSRTERENSQVRDRGVSNANKICNSNFLDHNMLDNKPHHSNLELSLMEQNLFNLNKRPVQKQVWFNDPQLDSNSTLMLCSQLYHCSTISEAVQWIAINRGTIENLTKIIVEAPAYRNYDMSNYKIDHSVKESFNPNFWLDREPIVTTADGNCQYHAVSLSLTGSESYTPEVRLAAAVAVVDNEIWFDSVLKLIDRGSVLDLVRVIVKSFSWGDETTLKAIAIAIKRRIYLYTCNIGKKDFEMVKSLNKDELIDAFKSKKYRGGTGIHAYADPLDNREFMQDEYIMLFHKSEHFIAVLPTNENPTNYEPYNPIVPQFF